jgi:hypothetical protein
MHGRLVAWGSVFGLLAATTVAAVMSTLYAPKVSPTPSLPSGNPRAAALTTAAVDADLSSGSFVADAVATTHRRGYSGTERYTLVYQAPDRSELISPQPANGGTIIAIGDMTYSNDMIRSVGPPGWIGCKAPAGIPTGASLATSDLVAFRQRSGIAVVGDRYRIVKLARTKTSGSGKEVPILTATVADGHLTEEDLQAHTPTETTHLTLRYSQFGSAPPIPMPQDVTSCPPSGRP